MMLEKKIQIQIAKYERGRTKIEWDDLLQIVKSVNGVKYVADQEFFPRTDITISDNKVPRLRGFRMLDLVGNIIQNKQGTLTPTFFPSNPSFSLLQSVLNNN